MTETDASKLARLIRLPYQPLSVRWQTAERPGGNDWSLTALLELSKDDVTDLLRSSTRLESGAQVDRGHLVAWFPGSLRRKYEGAPGDSVVVEAAHLDPAPFLAVDRSPLVHGDAIVFEQEGLVYLHLFTM